MYFAVVGLRRRCGMEVNRRVLPTRTVLSANSCAVSSGRTLAGTAGFLELAICEKSPFSILWPGSRAAAEYRRGVRLQRRSYEPRKKVRLLPGTGPENDPPTSFRLK